MKKLVSIFLVIIVSFSFYSYRLIDKKLSDILKQMQLTEEDAKDYVWSNFSYMSYSLPSTYELKKIAEAERPAIVRLAGAFAKEYSRTEDFAAKYREFRESSKPMPPQNQQSPDEMRAAQKTEIEAGIKSMEETMKLLTAEQQKDLQLAINEMKKQLAELDKPDSYMNSQDFDQGVEANNKAQMEDYKLNLAEWEKEYPESPKGMISGWLKRFLEESATVDFNAELKETPYGKKVFVNPQYESKPPLWKLCFRAGKNTVEAARGFAKEWLKELEK